MSGRTRRSALRGLGTGIAAFGAGCSTLRDLRRPVPTADWPARDYDAARTSHSPEAHVGDDYRVAWRADLPRWDLDTSAILRDGNVYAAGNRTRDEDESSVGVVARWNASTGDRRWLRELDDEIEGTPVVGDRHLFVPTVGVEALRVATGATGWEYESDGPEFGSLVLDGRTLYADADDEGIHALDAPRGRRRWRAEATDPVYTLTATPDSVFVPIDDTLVALDPANGSLRWSRIWYEVGRPMVGGDTVYVYRLACMESPGRFCFGCGALDARNGEPRWSTVLDGRPAAVDGSRLYAAGPDGLSALDGATGEPVWEVDPDGELWYLAITDDRGIATYRRKVEAIDLDTGRQIWTFDPDVDELNAAVVSSGWVFVTSYGGTVWGLSTH